MKKITNYIWRGQLMAMAIAAVATTVSLPARAAPPLPGAVFTAKAPATLGGPCTTTNSNIYVSKADVYLNGGPAHPGSAGLLPNTVYYVKVTDPSGATTLGNSVLNSPNPPSVTPVSTNAAGNFSQCYRLIDIVTLPTGGLGYDNTPNPGGEYKVWVSTVSTFDNNSTKTDNFKVDDGTVPPTDIGRIAIFKFYDTNANGRFDLGEPEILGWKVDLLGRTPKSTEALYDGLADGSYTAEEYTPIQNNWYATYVYVDNTAQTNAAATPLILNSTGVTLTSPDQNVHSVTFGNVCTGAGGGLTLGYWSNKNGEAVMTGAKNSATMSNALAFLTSLNLTNANTNSIITPFDPTTYTQFRTWLLSGNAVNMAYMLSVQLAAMELNVRFGSVSGGALVYAPGTNLANTNTGFASVADLMFEANASLGSNALTFPGMPQRSYQEGLKNALDNANNNKTFVQANPCTFSFANPVTPP